MHSVYVCSYRLIHRLETDLACYANSQSETLADAILDILFCARTFSTDRSSDNMDVILPQQSFCETLMTLASDADRSSKAAIPPWPHPQPGVSEEYSPRNQRRMC